MDERGGSGDRRHAVLARGALPDVESTVRYLGIEVAAALSISEQVDL